MTILLSAFGTLFGLALLNRLPRLNNPLFNSERFRRVTNDKFFVYVEAADPKFSPAEVRALLEQNGASAVEEIHDSED
jgi:hypothetical protein